MWPNIICSLKSLLPTVITFELVLTLVIAENINIRIIKILEIANIPFCILRVFMKSFFVLDLTFCKLIGVVSFSTILARKSTAKASIHAGIAPASI